MACEAGDGTTKKEGSAQKLGEEGHHSMTRIGQSRVIVWDAFSTGFIQAYSKRCLNHFRAQLGFIFGILSTSLTTAGVEEPGRSSCWRSWPRFTPSPPSPSAGPCSTQRRPEICSLTRPGPQKTAHSSAARSSNSRRPDPDHLGR